MFHLLVLGIHCPFRAMVFFDFTRRVAAGWLVLPFQGGGKNLLHF
jgi:hypothetical protein